MQDQECLLNISNELNYEKSFRSLPSNLAVTKTIPGCLIASAKP
jgi:hypothetical protein